MRVVDATMLLLALAKPTALMAAVRHESAPLRLLYTNKLFSLWVVSPLVLQCTIRVQRTQPALLPRVSEA
jgi:hypothetical protein